MMCIQVIGDDAAVAFAGSRGNFELNAMRLIIINNLLHSSRILADGCEKFRVYSVEGTQINEKRVAEYVQNSLMLVTALSPAIGYDWGTRLRYSPTKRFYVQAGADNADSHQLDGSQHGVNFSIRGPLFAIGEVGFRRFAQDDDRKPTRNIKAGGFYIGGTHYTVSNGALEAARGLYGFYALGDQQIWRLKPPSGTPRAEAELSRWGDAERQRHVGASRLSRP
jgi:hypothetical protein